MTAAQRILHREANRRWREKHPDAWNQWAKDNPEKRKEHAKKHRNSAAAKLKRKQYYEKNSERIKERDRHYRAANKEKKRERDFQNLYGISVADYHLVVKQQNGRCKICGKSVKLQVDHHHETGKFRGLLCTNCNTGLGLFKDNPDILNSALTYLVSSLETGSNI